jgi:hypothetical protein
MLHEHDVVALKKELPGTAVPVLSEGTIVQVHEAKAQAYVVEFFDDSDNTIGLFDVVGDDYLELKWAYRDTK